MKSILFFTILFQTSLTFASYSCDEEFSHLEVVFLNKNTVKVTYLDKKALRGPSIKVFQGKKNEAESQGYYRVESFKLLGLGGEATLKVSTFPVLSRVPTCTGRVCDSWLSSASKNEIFAELDQQGTIIHYDCQTF